MGHIMAMMSKQHQLGKPPGRRLLLLVLLMLVGCIASSLVRASSSSCVGWLPSPVPSPARRRTRLQLRVDAGSRSSSSSVPLAALAGGWGGDVQRRRRSRTGGWAAAGEQGAEENIAGAAGSAAAEDGNEEEMSPTELAAFWREERGLVSGESRSQLLAAAEAHRALRSRSVLVPALTTMEKAGGGLLAGGQRTCRSIKPSPFDLFSFSKAYKGESIH